MMDKMISPSRSLLIELKRQRKLVLEGKALLEKKRDIILREIEDAETKFKKIKEEVKALLNEASFLFVLIRALDGISGIKMMTLLNRKKVKITLKENIIMGAKHFEIVEVNLREPKLLKYDLPIIPIRVDELTELIENSRDLFIEYFNLYLRISTLKKELQKTNQKIGVLEHKVLKNLQEAIKFVTYALEERERFMVLVQKRIKSKKVNKSEKRSKALYGGYNKVEKEASMRELLMESPKGRNGFRASMYGVWQNNKSDAV